MFIKSKTVSIQMIINLSIIFIDLGLKKRRKALELARKHKERAAKLKKA